MSRVLGWVGAISPFVGWGIVSKLPVRHFAASFLSVIRGPFTRDRGIRVRNQRPAYNLLFTAYCLLPTVLLFATSLLR
jgi:hypothetical protein